MEEVVEEAALVRAAEAALDEEEEERDLETEEGEGEHHVDGGV